MRGGKFKGSCFFLVGEAKIGGEKDSKVLWHAAENKTSKRYAALLFLNLETRNAEPN